MYFHKQKAGIIITLWTDLLNIDSDPFWKCNSQ